MGLTNTDKLYSLISITTPSEKLKAIDSSKAFFKKLQTMDDSKRLDFLNEIKNLVPSTPRAGALLLSQLQFGRSEIEKGRCGLQIFDNLKLSDDEIAVFKEIFLLCRQQLPIVKDLKKELNKPKNSKFLKFCPDSWKSKTAENVSNPDAKITNHSIDQGGLFWQQQCWRTAYVIKCFYPRKFN